MDRITEIEIAGKRWPLNFSVRAAREVIDRYGEITGMSRALLGTLEGRNPAEETIWLLSVLLREGARYQSLTGGETLEPPGCDELESLVGYYDLSVSERLMVAVFGGMQTEIELEEAPKNAKPTRSR